MLLAKMAYGRGGGIGKGSYFLSEMIHSQSIWLCFLENRLGTYSEVLPLPREKRIRIIVLLCFI